MSMSNKKDDIDLDAIIQDTISDTNKAFKDSGFSKMQRAEDMDFISGLEFVSSGNYAINYLCTGNCFKAFARGRITSLVGDSGSGKSLLLNHVLAETQKSGGISVLFDVERGNYTGHLTNIGIDTNRLIVSPEKTIERMIEKTIFIVRKLREKNPNIPITIGWDSLSQASTRHEMDEGLKKVDMARARVIRAGFRIINGMISDTNVCLIIVNHQTTNMDASVNPKYLPSHKKYTTPGGTAVEHFPSQIIRVNKGKIVKNDDGVPIGVEIKATVEKSRFWIPFIKATILIDFKKGFDKSSGLYDILYNKQIILNPKRGYYAFSDDPETLIHGEKKVREIIKANPERFAKLISNDVQFSQEEIRPSDDECIDVKEANKSSEK